jgi:Tfp pilus assembly protein PilF
MDVRSGTEGVLVVAPESRAAGHPLMPTLSRLASYTLTVWGIPLALSLITLVVFSPVLWNDFVEWDDQMNLYENPAYRGLGTAQFRYFFTTVLLGHYIPLTWMTFGLDYVLWGMNPMGYHLTSLLVHAASAAALYLVALRILQKATTLAGAPLRVGAVAGTLFFMLHPLRAESVAWATERRDVLSGLFFFLALLAYLKMSDATGRRRGWLLVGAAGLYLLALASKASVMVLPAMLILLDIYPLRRVARKTLLEKIPFAVLGGAGAAVTYYAQNVNHFITPLERYPLLARIGMMFNSLWFYVEKTVLPLQLSPLYELPAKVNPLALRFLLPALAVTLITVTVVALRRRWPAGLTVWACYGVALGPVIGLIHSGHQLTHDRYSYLPAIALSLLLGGAAGVVAREAAAGVLRPSLVRALTVTGLVAGIGLAGLSFQQVQVWRDTDTLWRYAIDAEPDCAICRGNLGVYLSSRGLTQEARVHFERALAARPDQVKSYHYLGYLHALKGEHKGAAESYETYLKRYPNDADALTNMGATLMALGRPREALDLLRRAEKIKPNSPFVTTNLGYALGDTGHPAESLLYLRRAIGIKWDMAHPWSGLVRFFSETGQPDAARTALGILRMLDPVMANRAGPWALETW